MTLKTHGLPDMRGWTQRERVAYLSREGVEPKVIAALLGMKPATVRVVRAQLRAQGRVIPAAEAATGHAVAFRLPHAFSPRVKREAALRAMSVAELMTAVCVAAIESDLFAAVLDVGDEMEVGGEDDGEDGA